MTTICKKCVLPDSFPGIHYNDDGVCQYCAEHLSNHEEQQSIQEQVETFIQNKIGLSPSYDIVLAFSGGKDSTYTLKYLREKFDARIIAITIDNDFIAERAHQNCKQTTQALGVDHIFFRPNPKALMEIYNKSSSDNIHSKTALMRASEICNSCIQVINTQVVNFAANYSIPIVAGGYIGGQVPSETGFMKQNLKVTERARSGFMKKLSASFDTEAIRLFKQASSNAEIAIVNPMLYLKKSEEEIINDIVKIGWIKPSDTGISSTNCLLNDYAIESHKNKYKFHPYIFEISHMVRNGLLLREDALKKISTTVDASYMHTTKKRLHRFL